jgi:hypothetical protein
MFIKVTGKIQFTKPIIIIIKDVSRKKPSRRCARSFGRKLYNITERDDKRMS